VNWGGRWRTVRRVGILQVIFARSWILLRGDERVQSALMVAPESLVIDVGAYLGDFTALARERWSARVIAVEPIDKFCSTLLDRFRKDSSVEIIPGALGAKRGMIQISMADDGSSAWGSSDEQIEVKVMDVAEVINEQIVSLMKINAEGAEFDVLDRLIDTGQIEQIETLLIQFHKFVPDAERRRRVIRSRLRATHRVKFNVPWVWEQWIKLDTQSAS